MTYATLANLTDRFSEAMLVSLTDRGEFATGTVDVTVVNRALADTDAVIDGYLARRYALPLSVSQPLLTDIAGAIAIWKLHTSEPDPKIESDYKAAIAMLKDISTGVIALTAAGIEAPSTGGTGVQFTDRDRNMTQDNMTGLI